ncbi:MAG: hypothetical protein FWG42_09965 [Clostridiales bacterium]|nr:hypothetical protein [Clostridiales bacterium]
MSIKFKSIVAAVTAVALLTTGTFAFNQVISVTNEFLGQKDGVTLHDDFDPGLNQKDVYVENQGSMVMYVRIKLNEAMSLISHKWRPLSKESPAWVTHTLGTKDANNHWNCGHTSAKNSPNDTLTEEGKAFHDYFFWSMGGKKWYMPTDGKRPLVQDIKNYENVEGAKETPNAVIISAADFLAAAKADPEFAKGFTGWIYDTDGYAYWSQPLLPGEATGLLLNGVGLAQVLEHEEYYYAIDVILEAVDIKDIPMWRDGEESEDGSGKTYTEATDDGKEVIDIITGMHPEDAEYIVKILDGNQVLSVGETFNLDYTISDSLTGTPVWTTSNGGFVNVSQNGVITGVAEGTAVITLSVGSYSDSVVVTVTASGTTDPSKSVAIQGGNKTIEVGGIYTPGYTSVGTTGDPFWNTSNTGVAIVDSSGNIIGVGEGTATITLTIDGVSDTITITVVPATTGGGGGSELPVNPGPFTPIYNGNPETGDGSYYKQDFKDPSNALNNIYYHGGAVHLEDIITDGNYAGVTATAVDSKYAANIELGACSQHSGKQAILFSYKPTKEELRSYMAAQGKMNISIPVQVLMQRGSQSASVTINMLYTDCVWANY